MKQSDLAARVVELLGSAGPGGVLASDLVRRLELRGRGPRELDRVLCEMLETGRIQRCAANHLRLSAQSRSYSGIVRMRSPGRGLVVPQPGKPWPSLRSPGKLTLDSTDALRVRDGDLVQFHLQPARGTRPPRARLAEILRSTSTRQAGTYFERGVQRWVVLDGDHEQPPVAIADPGSRPPRPGDKVIVEVLRYPDRGDPGEAVLIDVLGAPSTSGIEISTVMHELGLPDRFPPAVEAEASRLAAEFDESDLGDRRDLTQTLSITIDPTDARDFDDAVSVERMADGTWRLWVHIADVSWFVAPGGAIDQEARLRGTSVYLPGRVLPMLPEVLSNALASLQAGRVRYTVTVDMRLGENGALLSCECYRSAIRVTRRMTYDEVTAVFAASRRPQELPAELWTLLREMRQLAAVLHQRRLARGAIELDLPEVRIDWGSEGQVLGAHLVPHDESHRLIEDFMLLANTAVARKLAAAKVPFLGRTHPPPEPMRLQGLLRFARGAGCPIRKIAGRGDLLRLLELAQGKAYEPAIHQAVLRSLSQAHYSPRLEGHFALALDDYCHFTSPIRRYPDLVVHRQLLALVSGERGGSKPGGADEFERLGEECSFTERRAERAERMATRLRLLRYLQDHLGRVCRGQVTGVSPLGLYLRLDFLPVEGLLKLGSLAGGRYRFDAETQSLVGIRSGERLRLGDWLGVRIARVDLRRRTLELSFVGDDSGNSTSNRRGENRDRTGESPARKNGGGSDGIRHGRKRALGNADADQSPNRKMAGKDSVRGRRRKPITPKHRRRKGSDRGRRG